MRTMKSWRSLLLLATLLLCSIRSFAAVHGLGGEGYSLWTGDEEARNAPTHNCAGDHDHKDHQHAAGHIHTHQDGAAHDHNEHAHGGHSHGAHSHGAHSHDDHSHSAHSRGGHSHGAHSHGAHSHDHAHHAHDHAHKHDHGVAEQGRAKTLEELELEEMATYGFSAAVEEKDFKPLSGWDKLVAGLGQSSWGKILI